MRADGTAFLVLTAVTASICAALAGCASGVSAQAPAASTINPLRQAGSQRPGHVIRPRQASAADPAARAGGPPAQTPPGAAPGPASHSPGVPGKVSAALTSGVYTDGPDGTPHYALSFAPGPGGVLSGSASFLYQDGRTSTAGSYAGTLSGRGAITLTLAGGKTLSGRYTAGHLDLAGCAAVLPLATFTGACSFTYHGHVP